MKANIFKPKDLISQQLLSFLLKECPRDEDGKLPAAAFFAEKYGVSIVTIREVLKSLESIGVLSLHHGRGIYLNHPESISQEMFETRIIIESNCARLAAEKLTAEDRPLLEECMEILEEAGQNGNMDLYTDADFMFHLEIARISRNLVLEKTLRNIRMFLFFQQKETNRLLLKSRENSLLEHKEIFHSIMSKDAAAAEAAMKAHLEKTRSLWEK